MNEVRDVNHIPQIVAAFKGFAETEVEIGIFGANAEQNVGESRITVLQLAQILHEGCNIKVTPKMRAYLHSLGLHLKDDTVFVRIPPRPFFDPVVQGRDAEEFVFEALRRGIDSAGPGDMRAAERTYERIGLGLETKIKTSMRNLRTPPNHPFTIKMKKSSNPLIDTGFLLSHVIHETRRASGKG
jgi:hypothetical protein